MEGHVKEKEIECKLSYMKIKELKKQIPSTHRVLPRLHTNRPSQANTQKLLIKSSSQNHQPRAESTIFEHTELKPTIASSKTALQ